MVSEDLRDWQGRGGAEGQGRSLNIGKAPPLAPPQHRPRQICDLKINTVWKETSHRENQYPAKDNGSPVQAAVICPLNTSTCQGQQSMLVNGQLL